MNRYFRRMTEFGKRWSSQRSGANVHPGETKEPDPRATSSGHRKKTADKWNQ